MTSCLPPHLTSLPPVGSCGSRSQLHEPISYTLFLDPSTLVSLCLILCCYILTHSTRFRFIREHPFDVRIQNESYIHSASSAVVILKDDNFQEILFDKGDTTTCQTKSEGACRVVGKIETRSSSKVCHKTLPMLRKSCFLGSLQEICSPQFPDSVLLSCIMNMRNRE